MGSSVFVARETPLTAANLNKHLAGDGLANTGDVALGGATGLFWDDANKRLGRGTTTPATALDWLDASAALHATWSTNGDADVIHWLTGDRDGDGAGARTAFVGLDYSANVLKIGRGSDFDGATGFLAMDTSGNVGIGTTAPSHKLSVRDGRIALSNNATDHGMTVLAATDVCGFLGVATATLGGLHARGLSDSDSGGLYLEGVIGTDTPSTTTPAVQIQANKKNGTTYQALAATDMAFAVQNATTRIFAMRGNGHVGINTSTPGSSIELNLATADLEIVDAGTAGATETAWIEIQVGNSTKFIRCFDTK